MGRSDKSKRITWASDLNLCQVKLFLSEESPSQVGIKTQDCPQTKTSLWAGQSSGNGPTDNLPPGFEGIHRRRNLSQIPLMNWRCPPRFEINNEWQVVAGDESNEMTAEDQRELRVLEAIYPWPSAIPPNPSVSDCVENSTANDQDTPLVPVTPIEEEEEDASSLGTTVLSSPHEKMPIESSIDTDLLVKILSNPKMVEQLVTSNGGPANTHMPLYNTPCSSLQSTPSIGLQRVTTPFNTRNMAFNTGPQYIPNSKSSPENLFDSTQIAVSRIDHPTTATGPFYPPPPPPQVRTALTPTSGAPVTKDINYYKSLIQQHGGEKRDVLPQFVCQSNQPMMNQEPFNFLVQSREPSKPKIMRRPCVYFNSPNGCRNGAKCAYQHDTTSDQQRINGFAPDVQIAKRVKLDREITLR